MENMITDEKLETVSGGDATVQGRTFSGQVDHYGLVKGQRYYIVTNDHAHWYYGQVEDTYESEVATIPLIYQFTERTHQFTTFWQDGVEDCRLKTFRACDVTVYSMMN